MNQEIQSATYESLCALIDQIAPTTSQKSVDIPQPVAQPVVDTSFNLTKPIQDKLDLLAPTVVFTDYEPIILPDTDIKSLVPVPDRTIHQLLILLAGKGTTSYMLDGSLIAHTAEGAYIKIIPIIDKDGYASYTFSAVNYRFFNQIIDRYCELLQKKLSGFKDVLDSLKNPSGGVCNDTCETDEAFNPFSQSKAPREAPKHPKRVSCDNEDDEDWDAHALKTLNTLLKARMQSTWHHMNCRDLYERLESTKAMYAEDQELLKYLKHTTKRVYKKQKAHYYMPFTKHFDPPYRISEHYLMEWMYEREDYTKYITNGNGAYQVDHVKRGKEYRSDNRRENLRIKPTKYNAGRTSRSIEVTYNGGESVSLSAYTKDTNAGSYYTILDLKDTLQPGESKEYNNRIYTKVDEHQLTVIDSQAKSPEITFNDETYSNLKAFADDINLGKNEYGALRQGIGRARKAGKTEYTYRHKAKKYTFYLDANGNTKITL